MIQIIDSLAVGGAEMMAVNIANALVEKKNESHICVTRNEGALKSKLNSEVNYIYLNKKRTIDIFALNRLIKHLKQYNIAIVHAHSSSYFIASLVKLVMPKLKIIWHDHYGNSEQLEHRKLFPLNYFSKNFDAIVTVNRLLEKWAKRQLKTNNIHYLPNFASLKNTETKTVLKGEKGKRIVCLAALRPQKDHINLLKAFKLVYQKHSDWSLHIVGHHFSDAYYKSILLFIGSNKLSNSVFLYHNSTDVKAILAQATIGVLASKSEGLPVALLEYGLSKLSVVVTDVGECKSVLIGEKYGKLAPASCETALSKKINNLIENKELRLQLAINFKKHILNNYSEKKHINSLIKIYTS